MRHFITPMTIGLLAFCVVAEVARELCFKAAADRANATPHYAPGLATQPLLWLGLLCWTAEAVSLVVVLERVPLSVAYPITNLPYAGIPLAGALLFRERLTRGQIAGAALIAIGVVCVGASGL
jgi:undecaprenyl phosphate-alpha-L-ara4N flippase subunit ArnE